VPLVKEAPAQKQSIALIKDSMLKLTPARWTVYFCKTS